MHQSMSFAFVHVKKKDRIGYGKEKIVFFFPTRRLTIRALQSSEQVFLHSTSKVSIFKHSGANFSPTRLDEEAQANDMTEVFGNRVNVSLQAHCSSTS